VLHRRNWILLGEDDLLLQVSKVVEITQMIAFKHVKTKINQSMAWVKDWMLNRTQTFLKSYRRSRCLMVIRIWGLKFKAVGMNIKTTRLGSMKCTWKM
jgi:hypothetical protein